MDDAVHRLGAMGVGAHPDVSEKSWDLCLALETIRMSVARTARILDVGARWSPILDGLERLGYRDVWACDLERSWRDDVRRLLRRSSVRFRRADLTATDFETSSFTAITSLSVIEHGVPVGDYLREMARLLEPGGLLLTSTDFWCEPIPTAGLYPYGPKFGEMRVFTPSDVREIIAEARRYGLHFDGTLDLECAEKVVTWRRMDRSYTFTYFELRRE